MAEQDLEPIIVNVENFTRAETDRMFFGIQSKSGGKINIFDHEREPTRLDAQNVFRMNRDTLYIGSGDIIAPQTELGKIVTVLYAAAGLGLLAAFFSSIAAVLLKRGRPEPRDTSEDQP